MLLVNVTVVYGFKEEGVFLTSLLTDDISAITMLVMSIRGILADLYVVKILVSAMIVITDPILNPNQTNLHVFVVSIKLTHGVIAGNTDNYLG